MNKIKLAEDGENVLKKALLGIYDVIIERTFSDRLNKSLFFRGIF